MTFKIIYIDERKGFVKNTLKLKKYSVCMYVCMYRVGQKEVYSCENMKPSVFLCCCLLIIVVFLYEQL